MTPKHPDTHSLPGRLPLALLGALLAVVFVACGNRTPILADLVDDDDCRHTVVVGVPAAAAEAAGTDSARQATLEGHGLDWRLPPESLEVGRLNAWCAAVGPAVVGGWGDTVPGTAVVDTLRVVSWNVHVGGGDLRRLVDDLREGRLTDGRPVEHFVLLLQEAYRGGELVPAAEAGEPGGSGVTDPPPDGLREHIVASAERLGLWVLYAPSMRNGQEEDRGNAILSTLPLQEPVAVELPVARQRRVAVAAEVRARTRGGRDWRLQVASVHLESSPSGWTSDEEQRLEQTEVLLSLLPDAEASITAGDFNTRPRGQDEALVRVMLRAYPDTPPFPLGPTYRRAMGLYREYLDYMFYRLPDGAEGGYDRVSSPYASDHYPLVGWVGW